MDEEYEDEEFVDEGLDERDLEDDLRAREEAFHYAEEDILETIRKRKKDDERK